MPQLFRKVLTTAGTHHTPQGPLTLTPSRAERYARKFRQLKQKFRFPQPWGHRLSAMPQPNATEEEKEASAEQRQFELARWNSGYIQDVEATPEGNLVIVGQVPPGYSVDKESGDLVNPVDGTRIGEISGAFGNWRDGEGNRHKDILVHAALVTHPVNAGTGGFEKVEKVVPGMHTLSAAGEIEYTFFLSSRSPDMAKDKDKDDDKDDLDKAIGSDKSLDKSPIEETVTEEDEYTPEPEPIVEPPAPIAPLPVTPLPPSGDLMPKVKQLEGMFGEMQISLPPSEDVATFVNNMLVAITVARSLGVKFNKPGDDQDSASQQTTMQSGQDKPPSPEAPPIMMSTLSGPALALAEREQNRMRSDTAKVWEENKKLGVPVSICDRESAKSETIMLSLTSTGKPKTHQRLKEARLVREVIQGVRGTINDQDQMLLKQLSSPPNPAEAANAIQVKETEEIHSAIKAGARSAASKMTVNTKV